MSLQVSNLYCSYTGLEKDKVLFIENLEIAEGKIIFLVGASGSGKSTFLETIGLMNNTVVKGNIQIAFDTTKTTNIAELWRNGNEEEINKIRKNFLSFIFQNTNLMENFTAYENICLSQMIKSNTGQEKTLMGARDLMNKVGLPESEVDFDVLPTNLSGGQRQRVAFVRALNTDFKILLCDEPTGNLDEVNANELLTILKQNIGEKRTAILVSHDINLALKFADSIVLITKNTSEGHGEILSQNVFNKSAWQNLNAEELSQFRNKIVSQFSVKADAAKKQKQPETSSPLNLTYKKLFAQREGKVLFGKSYINILVLVLIISLTFLAVGFANGALDFLNKKYNDAFVNWLSVEIPYTKSSTSAVDELTEKLNEEDTRKKFIIDTVTAYKDSYITIFNSNQTETEGTVYKGRTLPEDDPLTKDLLKDGNVIRGKKFVDEEKDLGIIVTESFLNKLGYANDAPFIFLDAGNLNDTKELHTNFRVPIPVRAVIKEIPGRNNFLITEFFLLHYQDVNGIFDFREQSQKIILYAGEDKNFAVTIRDEIRNMVNADSVSAEIEPCRLYDKNKSWQVNVSFITKPDDYSVTENLYSKITEASFFKNNKNKLNRIFDFDSPKNLVNDLNNDYLSINLAEGGLDRVDSLSEFINKELNSGKEKDEMNLIQMDTRFLKEKKNFNYIGKMTGLISSLLIVFSILAISLFISNLLKAHLNKVKMNLGTYKAFGLSDKESVSIYLQIMLRFIFIGLAVSFVAALFLGELISLWIQNNLNIDEQVNYFMLYDMPQTYILVLIIICVTTFVSYININRILSKTPGDLIYNR